MDKPKKDPTTSKTQKSRISRRNFVKGAATVAAAAATVPLKPLLGDPGSIVEASTINYEPNKRTNDSFIYRRNTAIANKINVGELPDNGDRARYNDFSALHSKALRHDALGVPNKLSYQSLIDALETDTQNNFLALQNVIVGTPGGGPNSRLNGPATSFAFDLEGLDSHAFTIPPPSPTVRSAQTATEQVEHYWAALLRDVPFTEYETDTTGLVQAAVNDLNSRSFLIGGGANQWALPVTRQNLFRSRVASTANDGNLKGPYISQFMLQPTSFGSQPLDQRHNTFAPNQDFMTDFTSYQNVQNGGFSGNPIPDPTRRFIRNGRDLTAYTRVDVLYQGYFVAFLLLAGLGTPLTPGNPYIGSNTPKAVRYAGWARRRGDTCGNGDARTQSLLVPQVDRLTCASDQRNTVRWSKQGAPVVHPCLKLPRSCTTTSLAQPCCPGSSRSMAPTLCPRHTPRARRRTPATREAMQLWQARVPLR